MTGCGFRVANLMRMTRASPKERPQRLHSLLRPQTARRRPKLGRFRLGLLGEVQQLLDERPAMHGGCSAASGRLVVVSATAAYAARASDGFIKADATSASFTVTLPSASDAGTGKLMTIKKNRLVDQRGDPRRQRVRR